MLFSMETEKENKLSFLDVEIIRDKANLQPQFIENLLLVTYILTLKNFLPLVYISGMVYSLVYRCFYTNWTQFHTELTFLKGIFQKNGYSENLLTNVLKNF